MYCGATFDLRHCGLRSLIAFSHKIVIGFGLLLLVFSLRVVFGECGILVQSQRFAAAR